MRNWNTSVNELMAIFKGSLLSIIPWVEKAKIKWENEEAYDDWDNIATALYENIVCSSIYSAVIPDYNMPKYDLIHTDYSSVDFISIENQKNQILAFVSFLTKVTPFDYIQVAVLDSNYQLIEHIIMQDSNIEYSFAKHANGKLNVSSTVGVIL